MMSKICDTCEEPFLVKVYIHKRGQGRYCSIVCRNQESSNRTPGQFWNEIDKSGGPDACWYWKGKKDPTIYYRTKLRGKEVKVYRASWEFVNGPIPEGLCGLHKCDNPPCCNPSHIFVGTAIDNVQDRTRKGRSARGAKNAWAKLTEQDVIEIRKSTETGTVLAIKYKLDATSISDIRRRKTWKHI